MTNQPALTQHEPRLDVKGTQSMSETIMIVDDEPAMLALLEIIFKRKGFTVLTASGAYQALNLLAKEKPDLIILDVMMPGISGLELCRRLRTDPSTAKTPVLILSGWSDLEAAQRSIAAGANDFLTKTTPPTHIVKKVQALLSHSKQQPFGML